MKAKRKLSLDEAARRLSEITEKHLSKLSTSKRKKKLKAFKDAVSDPSSFHQEDIGDTPAIPQLTRRTQTARVSARGQE